LSGALAVLLLVFRQNAAAGGALMGFALFAGNALLLYESGRVLLASSSSSVVRRVSGPVEACWSPR